MGGICLLSFIVGYGLITVAFSSMSGLADVALVPDIRGQSAGEASRRLDAMGFSLLVSDSFPNVEAAEGVILTQSPLPGQEVSAGIQVSVTVSTGGPKETVPDITGMPLPLARRTLEAAGFEVLTEDVAGAGPVGSIVETVPEVGTEVRFPAVVVLRISISPPYWFMPDVTGMGEDAAILTLESTGLKVSEVRYDRVSGFLPYQVAVQQPLAGDSVDVNTFVRVLISLPTEDPGDFRDGGPSVEDLLSLPETNRSGPSVSDQPAGN
jgi:serine/threonine-protein kinase